MKKIYLACPYSNPDPQIMEYRFNEVTKKAADLIQQGYIVYSPITHNHFIAVKYGLPRGWEFWKEFDISFIKWCDVVCILSLDGWKESKGIDAEINIAAKLGKTVVMLYV